MMVNSAGKEICRELLDENLSLTKKAYILGQLSLREPTASEVFAFREEIYSRATLLDLGKQKNLTDICGTGGDGKDSFNISTCAAFVLASLGIKVAKHGNAASTSTHGSSDILNALGVSLTSSKDIISKQLEETNLSFLHAPLFHPCLKVLAPLRRELKVKTIFNMLGPLLNPASINYNIAGVSSYSLYKTYRVVLNQLEKNFLVLYSRDGYDEISLTDHFYIGSKTSDRYYDINNFKIDGKSLRLDPKEISSKKTPEESVTLVESILKGEASSQCINVVAINVGAAISLVQEVSLEEGFMVAKKQLLSGSAFNILEKLRLINAN